MRQKYGLPNYSKDSLSSGVKRIVIATTQKFQGNISSEKVFMGKKTPYENLELNIGGVGHMAAYINVLRQFYESQPILIETGPIFNSKDSAKKKSQILKLYDYLEYDAVLFGPNEFLFLNSQNYSANEDLKKFFVSSSLLDLDEGKIIDNEYSAPFKIVERQGVKIGLVGLTTYRALPSAQELDQYRILIKDSVAALLKAHFQLKSKKVDIVVALTDIQGNCQVKDKHLDCPKDDPFKIFLDRLPPNIVDVVIGNGMHPISSQYKNIAVLQHPGKSKFLSHAELFYDLEEKKLLKNQTIFLGPIKTCHQFLALTQDCHPLAADNKLTKTKLPNNEPNIIKAKFLGKTIDADESAQAIFQEKGPKPASNLDTD